MNTNLLYIKYLVILTALQLVGCSAFQSASYSEPMIDSNEVSQFRYGDGIAFEQHGICIAVREGFFAADYRNLTAGPLIFPIIPVEIGPGRDDAEFPLYEIDLEFIPFKNTKRITFDPTKVVLKLKDGSILNPYDIWLVPLTTPPVQPRPLTYLPKMIKLRFKKGTDTFQMSELYLNGLSQQDTKLNVPKVIFGPRTTRYRFMHAFWFSGRSRNNIPSSWGSKIPPKCNH